MLDSEGKAVAGAEVTVSSMARLVVNRIEDLPRGQIGQEFGQRSVTAADGRFEISGLAGGQYTVHVNADGFDRLSHDDVPAGTKDLRLVPVRLGGLYVEIDSDGDGQPVKGARIKATPAADDVPWGRPNDQLLPVLTGQPALDAAAKAGRRGRRLLRAARRAARHQARRPPADGFATREIDGPARRLGRDRQRDGAPRAGERVVAGHVQRGDGTPIAGAKVTLAAPAPGRRRATARSAVAPASGARAAS